MTPGGLIWSLSGREIIALTKGTAAIRWPSGSAAVYRKNSNDAATAASLLLQHGCPIDTLRQALTRNGDGSGSGPLARALDLLAE